MEASSLYNHPEKQDFFSEEVKKLGLDPAKTTTFEWLEVDDRVSQTNASVLMDRSSHREEMTTLIANAANEHSLLKGTAHGAVVTTVPLDLRLDQRRRDVFGWPDVETATEFAVAQAVKEINAQPDGKPYNKASPCL